MQETKVPDDDSGTILGSAICETAILDAEGRKPPADTDRPASDDKSPPSVPPTKSS